MDPRSGGGGLGGAHGSSSAMGQGGGQGAAAAGLRLPDAWLQQSDQSSSLDDAAASNQQQFLHELLRQRSLSDGANWDSKLPPHNKQSDSSM
jgi:hypothetical protein